MWGKLWVRSGKLWVIHEVCRRRHGHCPWRNCATHENFCMICKGKLLMKINCAPHGIFWLSCGANDKHIIMICAVWTQNRLCRYLCCFDAKFICLEFLRLFLEHKSTQKSCSWSKNYKYHVCFGWQINYSGALQEVVNRPTRWSLFFVCLGFWYWKKLKGTGNKKIIIC